MQLLREWERDHQTAQWSLSQRLGHKIRSLLDLGSDPCNVAHLARLYVAQLLSLCDTNHTTQQEDGQW